MGTSFFFCFVPEGILGTRGYFRVPEGILVFLFVGTRMYFGYHLEGVTGIAQWSCTRRLSTTRSRVRIPPPAGGGRSIINQGDQS